jgi:hypothetical protein
MNAFKKVDCTIQGLLIIVGLFLGLLAASMSDELFFAGYFLVGGWQLLSVIVHFFYTAPYETRLRKIYLITLALVFLIIVFSFLTEGIIMVLLGLLFFSPVMAVYYLVTCIRETQHLSLIMAQESASVTGGT